MERYFRATSKNYDLHDNYKDVAIANTCHGPDKAIDSFLENNCHNVVKWRIVSVLVNKERHSLTHTTSIQHNAHNLKIL